MIVTDDIGTFAQQLQGSAPPTSPTCLVSRHSPVFPLPPHTGVVASVNEYTILKELGKGSFAEVKLCKRLGSMGGVSGSLDEKAEEKSPATSPVMMTISEDEESGQELYVSQTPLCTHVEREWELISCTRGA